VRCGGGWKRFHGGAIEALPEETGSNKLGQTFGTPRQSSTRPHRNAKYAHLCATRSKDFSVVRQFEKDRNPGDHERKETGQKLSSEPRINFRVATIRELGIFGKRYGVYRDQSQRVLCQPKLPRSGGREEASFDGVHSGLCRAGLCVTLRLLFAPSETLGP
jgi:hypothetical protein